MEKIKAYIDGIEIEVEKGTTILEAGDKAGVHVPRLCYHPFLSKEGACRICVVDVEGWRNKVPACATPVAEGMHIRTNSPELHEIRRDLVELMLDNHPKECLTCERDGNCELQNLAYKLGVRHRLFEGSRKIHPIEDSSHSVVRNAEKCILCRRCVRVCSEIQSIHNLTQLHRGVDTVVAPAHEKNMLESVCIMCGQCINVCPTAAFTEKNETDKIWEAISNPNKHVVVQVAPAIRAAIGEGWDMPYGPENTGKTVSALRRLGFDAVFDTNFAADLTIVEEANELVERLSTGKKLPMITSCSPGWINFMEKFYPEIMEHVSTCKSPMQMLSTLTKTYYAKTRGIDPENIYMVSVMPCVAKKFEGHREEHRAPEGYFYNDAVITTRELIWMIKAYGIDFANLPADDFDMPLGFSTGAGDIFGSTGGVMEAALRTAYEKLTNEKIDKLDFEDIRMAEGLKEATIEIKGKKINIAVANGLNNAKTILEKVKEGKKQYHLIEIMACPGGCVAGGGQPIPRVEKYVYPMDKDIVKKRQLALYSIDERKVVRKSHENPFITKLYEEFLGHPGGHMAHELLHTTYREQFPRGIK